MFKDGAIRFVDMYLALLTIFCGLLLYQFHKVVTNNITMMPWIQEWIANVVPILSLKELTKRLHNITATT